MKILLDIVPARGHVNATLGLSGEMRKLGAQVVYGSIATIQEDVQGYGFQFESLPYIPMMSIRFEQPTVRLHDPINQSAAGEEKLQALSNSIDAFLTKIRRISPDLVFLDEQAALKAILYEQLNVPVIVFQTQLETRQTKGIPPFTSYYIPKFNALSNCICSCLWELKVVQYKFNRLLNKVFCVGLDDYSIVDRYFRAQGIELRDRIELRRSFGIGIHGVPRLIISPKPLDFPQPASAGTYRIGLVGKFERIERVTTARYELLKAELKQDNGRARRFVIYCSMGTITTNFTEKVTKFFVKMRNLATRNPNFLVILSVGTDCNTTELLPAPKNLYIFDYVPQVDLLSHCDLMITHGGMNSIVECIYNQVPMLVYPLSSDWDQPGNSTRVLYHKLGLRGNRSMDSVDKISKKVKHLISNQALYKSNINRMRAKFETEARGGAGELRRIINEILIQR